MEITSHSFLMSTNCRFLFLAISQSLFNLVFSPFLLIIPFLFYKFTEKGWAFLNFFENTKRDSVLIHFHFFIINLDLSILTLFSVCWIFPLVSYWIFVAYLIFCLFAFYAFIHHECKEVLPGLVLFIEDRAKNLIIPHLVSRILSSYTK